MQPNGISLSVNMYIGTMIWSQSPVSGKRHKEEIYVLYINFILNLK